MLAMVVNDDAGKPAPTSGQRFERRIDTLQNLGFALLPQYKVIICLSASTLYTLAGNFSK